jgi:hypothetical protein
MFGACAIRIWNVDSYCDTQASIDHKQYMTDTNWFWQGD